MKNRICVLAWLFISINSYGQATFSKLYWNYPYSTLGQAIAFDNSNFYITGRGASYIDGLLYLNNFFIKTDELGNQLLVKHVIGDSHNIWGNNYSGGLEFVNDTSLIFAGNFYNYDTLFPPLNEEHNGLLYKYNIEGDTIFTKSYIGDGYTEFARLITAGEAIYLGGFTEDTIPHPNYTYLVKTDLEGNVIWEQKEGDLVHSEIGGLMDFLSDGGIIAGGIIDRDIGPELVRNGKLYKTDSNGDSYFSKEIGTEGDDSEIEVKVAKNAASYIVRQYIDTVINEGDYEFVQYIGKMDTNGNFIWRTFLNDIYYKYIYMLRTFEDGSIVAVGAKITDETYEPHGYIVKLDSNGTVKWERDYTNNPNGNHYLYDFQKMPDGGYICTGLGADTIEGEIQSMCWLLRLDSMGCLEPGCDEVPVVNTAVNENSMVSIYPNPVTGISTVEVRIASSFTVIPGAKLELNMYDLNGRLVDRYSNISVSNPGETIRFSLYKKNLAAGIYVARLSYGVTVLGEVKISMD